MLYVSHGRKYYNRYMMKNNKKEEENFSQIEVMEGGVS